MLLTLALLLPPFSSAEEDKQVQVGGITVSLPARDTVMDSSRGRTRGVDRLYLLTRDVDGLIKSYAYFVWDSVGEERSRPYLHGYSVAVPSGLKLEPGQIPIRVIRSTCSGGAEFMAVATLGFTLPRWESQIYYSLYVFRKSSGPFERIYYRGQIGQTLTDLVFRDVDGDCRPELVDVGRTGHVAFANVQIVRPNGSVHLVQQIGGSEVELSDDGPSRFSIEADDSYPGEKGLCYVVGYRGWWDPEARKFKTIFERESTEPEFPAHRHVTEPKESVEPGGTNSADRGGGRTRESEHRQP